eukprot:scaffold827_cov369-Prasinococcus_capsulatus_cf.AAC.5
MALVTQTQTTTSFYPLTTRAKLQMTTARYVPSAPPMPMRHGHASECHCAPCRSGPRSCARRPRLVRPSECAHSPAPAR